MLDTKVEAAQDKLIDVIEKSDDARRKLKNVELRNTQAEDAHDVWQAETLERKKELDQIEMTKATVLSEVQELKSEKVSMHNDIVEDEATLAQIKAEIEALEAEKLQYLADYEQQKTDMDADQVKKETAIRDLEATLVRLSLEIEERELRESLTRNDLAKWERTLQERDQNLRIRETKVGQSEDKLVRNSKLLNL